MLEYLDDIKIWHAFHEQQQNNGSKLYLKQAFLFDIITGFFSFDTVATNVTLLSYMFVLNTAINL